MQTSHQRAIDDQERKHQVKKYSNYFRPFIFSSIMVDGYIVAQFNLWLNSTFLHTAILSLIKDSANI